MDDDVKLRSVHCSIFCRTRSLGMLAKLETGTVENIWAGWGPGGVRYEVNENGHCTNLEPREEVLNIERS